VSARVVGLDLSMSATGIAEHDGTTRVVMPRRTGDRRLNEIVGQVMIAVRGIPDLIVIEDVVTRSPAASSLGMVHGAVRLMLAEHGLKYVLIPPATLKRYATGKGNATKSDMRMALYQRMGIDLRDDNQVDATWLRYAGLDLVGAPVVKVPAAQAAALDKLRDAIGGAR
jgi:Holliday junction resolvasome RuvABC endonuclease subunit